MIAEATAFDPFFEREHPRLVRTLLAMTGRRAVAEELAQEALFAAYRRWSTVSGLERPDLWVRRVAMNGAISAHRRVVAEAAALARVAAWRTDDVPALELRDDALWAAVRRLPRRQAAALVLSMEGHTAREVGDVLGCSEETARTHLRRAKAALSSRLDQGGAA